MQTKHTPGPWTDHGLAVCDDRRKLISQGVFDATDQTVWNSLFEESEISYEAASANARLIAAAPDLLAALESIAAYKDRPLDQRSIMDAAGMCQTAIDAIAKATA
jgi:hypothetical protein